MIELIEQWLALATRLKTEWGMPLFVVLSYTFTTLAGISLVRAIKLDRRDAHPTKPPLSRIATRFVAFAIALPVQFVVGFSFWHLPFVDSLAHGFVAGAMVPIVADMWIRFLYWRGLHDQASAFKVDRMRRASDESVDNIAPLPDMAAMSDEEKERRRRVMTDGDDTAEIERL
jgi:hypothetical protein